MIFFSKTKIPPPGIFSLFIISTEVKLALILNQAESHRIKPTTSAEHIAREDSYRKIDGPR